MKIRTKELFEITAKTFERFNTERETMLYGKIKVAGFDVKIGTTKYIVRVSKSNDVLYIVRIYSRNDKLLKTINVEPEYNSFETTAIKFFGIYLQMLYTFGLLNLF